MVQVPRVTRLVALQIPYGFVPFCVIEPFRHSPYTGTLKRFVCFSDTFCWVLSSQPCMHDKSTFGGVEHFILYMFTLALVFMDVPSKNAYAGSVQRNVTFPTVDEFAVHTPASDETHGVLLGENVAVRLLDVHACLTICEQFGAVADKHVKQSCPRGWVQIRPIQTDFHDVVLR
eukprot:m.1339825 g.1339825  ORF g.1339825 m.1339825 type:complete len:174 (+) comp24889_c1_seq12:518-1039(+)